MGEPRLSVARLRLAIAQSARIWPDPPVLTHLHRQSGSPGGRDGRVWLRGAASLLALCAIAAGARWFRGFSGDALIHVCVMRQSAHGRWFQFDPHGGLVGSSSPLWTLLGALVWKVGGLAAALAAMKVVGAVAWVGLGVTTGLLARRVGASVAVSWVMGLLAIALPGTTQNALQGMENGTFALCVVCTLLLFARQIRMNRPATGTTLVLFGLAGLSIALRPEGVVVAVALGLGWSCWVRGVDRKSYARRIMVALAAGVAVSASTWGFYWAATGHLVPASAVSRVMMARRQGWTLHIGPMWIYLRAITRLLAYAPLALLAVLGARRSLAKDDRGDRVLIRTIAGALVGGLLLYSLATGAAQTSRYLIWVFALLCVLAARGVESVWVTGSTAWQRSALALAAVWILSVGCAETWLRLTRLSPGIGWGKVLNGFDQRHQTTSRLLEHLCAHDCCNRFQGAPRIAAVEVQVRLFLDRRISVESLDGVTGGRDFAPMKYSDEGCPRLGSLLSDPRLVGLMGAPAAAPCAGEPGLAPLVKAVRDRKNVGDWRWDPVVGLVRDCGRALTTGAP